MKLSFFFVFSFFILFMLILLIFFLIFNTLLEDSYKGTSFECGFSSISSSGIVFSMPFFVISIMFLLFDVEILVLCFYPFFILGGYNLLFFIYLVSFVVLVSTIFEWMKGVLNWF